MDAITLATWTNIAVTCVLVVITAYYAIVTRKILAENEKSVQVMKDQFQASMRPYVNVTAFRYPGDRLLRLRISNLGHSAAENLTLRIDKSFYQFNLEEPDRDLRNFDVFNRTIKTFAPNAELIIDLGLGLYVYKNPELTPMEFTILATYDFAGVRATEATVVDLHALKGGAVNPEPMLGALQKLAEVIERKS